MDRASVLCWTGVSMPVIVTAASALPAGASGRTALSPGDQQWASRFDGPGHLDDGASGSDVGPSGTVYLAGTIGTGPAISTDYGTIAYNPTTGATLWGRTYNGPGSSGDSALGVAASTDGTAVVVTGGGTGGSAFGDYATIAYDASTGALRWGKRYNGPGNAVDTAYAIAVSPDGTKVFVTGGSLGVSSDLDYATIAYDTSTGALVWGKRYNGPGNGYD